MKRRTIWRARVFGVTWLLYAGYYLCRKNLPVAQPVFMGELGLDAAAAGVAVTAYLVLYAAGQFLNGALGDRFGARRTIAAGVVLAILANVLFGWAGTVGAMAFLWGLNGLGQSSGWPGSMKTMSAWFGVKERGHVMGWWTTCYQVGEVVAAAFAAWLISPAVTASLDGLTGRTGTTWQYAFWVPAAGFALIGAVFLWGQRDDPRDAGVAPPDDHRRERRSRHDGHRFAAVLDVLENKYIWILGLTYFCVKLVRYTFLFWLSTYLVTQLGFRPDKAGYMNVILPFAGFLGAVAAGYASERWFGARRAPVSTLMLLGLAMAVFWYERVAADPLLGAGALALIGFMTFGPDTLVSATSAMDFGSRRGAATAAGFINGMGSIGAAVQGVLVGWLATRAGWNAVFSLLIALALLGAAIQSLMWNAKGKN